MISLYSQPSKIFRKIFGGHFPGDKHVAVCNRPENWNSPTWSVTSRELWSKMVVSWLIKDFFTDLYHLVLLINLHLADLYKNNQYCSSVVAVCMTYLIARVIIISWFLSWCMWLHVNACHGDASVLRLSEKLATCNNFSQPWRCSEPISTCGEI